MKIAVVYFSGTGNTEALAKAVQEELNGKAEVSVIDPATFDSASLSAFDAAAFGCPAMGAEELDDSIEEMMGRVEGSLSGKKLILFGSYGWGDGEWMRNWEERCKAAGAVLVADPVICADAPDDAALQSVKSAASALLG